MEHSTFESNSIKYRIDVGARSEFATDITLIVSSLQPREHVQRRFLECNFPCSTSCDRYSAIQLVGSMLH